MEIDLNIAVSQYNNSYTSKDDFVLKVVQRY